MNGSRDFGGTVICRQKRGRFALSAERRNRPRERACVAGVLVTDSGQQSWPLPSGEKALDQLHSQANSHPYSSGCSHLPPSTSETCRDCQKKAASHPCRSMPERCESAGTHRDVTFVTELQSASTASPKSSKRETFRELSMNYGMLAFLCSQVDSRQTQDDVGFADVPAILQTQDSDLTLRMRDTSCHEMPSQTTIHSLCP
jgi:hypothetical protein